MSTTNDDRKYWPYAVSAADAADPAVAEKITFLKAAFVAGTESYTFGINNYGARTEHRCGIVLERGRRRWELRLLQDDVRHFSAFVACFATAGNAVISWLGGHSVSDVLEEISKVLVIPPGLKSSYTIHEPADD